MSKHTSVVDEERGYEPEGCTEKTRRVTYRRLLVFYFTACALLMALLVGLRVGMSNTRLLETRREKQGCDQRRDRISDWGLFLSARASFIGSAMSAQQQQLPFLLPDASLYAGVAASVRFLDEPHNGETVAGGSIFWHPAVARADRETYESHMSAEYAFQVSITDLHYQGDQVWAATTQPAPNRPTYYPLSTIWGAKSPAFLKTWVGKDAAPDNLTTISVLAARTFYKWKLTSTSARDPSGESIDDDFFIVSIPYCGVLDCDDDDNATVLGLVVHTVTRVKWTSLFPRHVEVTALGGEKVKSANASKYTNNVNSYEPHLELELRCFYDKRSAFQTAGTYLWVSAIGILISIIVLVKVLISIDVKMEHTRANASFARAEEILANKALASAEERLSDNVKMDRYLSHEFKNRIIVLLDSIRCARSDFDVPDSPLPDALRARLDDIMIIADELLETTQKKSVLLHLATGVYSARLDDTDLPNLLQTRLTRYLGADRGPTSAPTLGAAAAHGASLLLDPMLINIILDNLLSNALKYGDAEQPPSVVLQIEPLEEGVVSVSLTVCNAAGPGHAHLLELGEVELNNVAAREGARAHEQLSASESTSKGDGFPMAVASARALGGTLRLGLSQSQVVARLSLPCVKHEVAAHFGAMEISELSTAIVDDSRSVRKIMKQKYERAFASCLTPIVAGETRASIEAFPRTVVDADVDVLFVDQNFGDVHQTKMGTDLVREIRALDLEAGNPRRLIFVVSANDAPDDLMLYLGAGADGHVSKSASIEQLRIQVCRLASNSDRFRGRVTSRVQTL